MKISSLFISLIIILFACAENTPKPTVANSTPIPQPISTPPPLPTIDTFMVLDTLLKMGNDSIRLAIEGIDEEDDFPYYFIHSFYKQGQNWQLTKTDSLFSAIRIEEFLLKDYNQDKLQDLVIHWIMDEGGGGQAIHLYFYNKKAHYFQIAYDDTNEFLPNVDNGGAASVDEFLQMSNKNPIYYYVYITDYSADYSSQTIYCGYFDDFKFKKIAEGFWADFHENDEETDGDSIHFYIGAAYNHITGEKSIPFAALPYEYSDTSNLRQIMIAYFEKNLPKIIQKHKALKQKRN